MEKLADISAFESLGSGSCSTPVYNWFGRQEQNTGNQQGLTQQQVKGLKDLKNALLEFGKYVDQDKETIKAFVIGLLDGTLKFE